MTTAAVIVAAGKGERMCGDAGAPPKQLRLIAGKPILAYSIEFFAGLDAIDCLCFVTRPELRGAVEQLDATRAVAKPIYWAEGGKRRQDSSRNGLRALPDEVVVVAVHDAVRPFPSREATERAIELARQHGAAMLAAPMIDTVKRADPLGRVIATVDRANLWLAQTPQVFQRALLEEAFDAAERSGEQITDEASALEAIGRPPMIVPSSPRNLKITTPDDLVHAEAIAAAGNEK